MPTQVLTQIPTQIPTQINDCGDLPYWEKLEIYKGWCGTWGMIRGKIGLLGVVLLGLLRMVRGLSLVYAEKTVSIYNLILTNWVYFGVSICLGTLVAMFTAAAFLSSCFGKSSRKTCVFLGFWMTCSSMVLILLLPVSAHNLTGGLFKLGLVGVVPVLASINLLARQARLFKSRGMLLSMAIGVGLFVGCCLVGFPLIAAMLAVLPLLYLDLDDMLHKPDRNGSIEHTKYARRVLVFMVVTYLICCMVILALHWMVEMAEIRRMLEEEHQRELERLAEEARKKLEGQLPTRPTPTIDEINEIDGSPVFGIGFNRIFDMIRPYLPKFKLGPL
ncbi:hypothetical protein NEHOM01_1474 [Nematocida homosporus]|uniref:uncharacterized protein n=1 Tax=Nematocida homosporus TaxID=1912981 RepID=UPI00221FD03B|nr:uncharacterized protein NEHOM01_1474 [Nematocida homosporus]KAI5186441.1 hypothetical protein NEHOM01_1474 [Nematocida homosporus]